MIIVRIIKSVVPLSLLLFASNAMAEEDITVKVEEKVLIYSNPHKMGDDDCRFCHVPDEKGKYDARLYKKKIDALCADCHKEDADHVIDPFPYDHAGLTRELAGRGVSIGKEGINCITCHDKHADSKKPFFLNDAVYTLYVEATKISPHWVKGRCFSCHRVDPGKSVSDFKRKGDMVKVCKNCHGKIAIEEYIHAVGMVPSAGKKSRMPKNFALDGEGKVSCITCHELKYQCLEKEYYRREKDPLFFRGGPYASRTDLCYNCHKKENYKVLNPHDQINDEGELVEDVCLYCHEEVPDPQRDKDIYNVKFVTEQLKDLCQRCHRDRPHPGGRFMNFDHLVRPPKRISFWMRHSAQVKGITLPLEPDTEKIFCCTCHNPHERGVLRGAPGRGADDKMRLRLGAGFEICSACHYDQAGSHAEGGSR